MTAYLGVAYLSYVEFVSYAEVVVTWIVILILCSKLTIIAIITSFRRARGHLKKELKLEKYFVKLEVI